MQRSTTPLPQHPRARTTFAPPIFQIEIWALNCIDLKLVHVLSACKHVGTAEGDVNMSGSQRDRCWPKMLPWGRYGCRSMLFVDDMQAFFWLDCAPGLRSRNICTLLSGGLNVNHVHVCTHPKLSRATHTATNTATHTAIHTATHFYLTLVCNFFLSQSGQMSLSSGLHVEIGLHPVDSRMPQESVFIEQKRISLERGRGIGSHPTSAHVPITHAKRCGHKRHTWWARCARWQGALAPVATGLSACGVCDLVSEPRLRADGCSTAHHRASVWTPRTRHCDRALGWGSCCGLSDGCSLHAPQQKRCAARLSANPSTCWNSDYLDCFWKTISWQRLQLQSWVARGGKDPRAVSHRVSKSIVAWNLSIRRQLWVLVSGLDSKGQRGCQRGRVERVLLRCVCVYVHTCLTHVLKRLAAMCHSGYVRHRISGSQSK